MKTYPFSLREAARRARVSRVAIDAKAVTPKDKRESARRAHVANAKKRSGRLGIQLQPTEEMGGEIGTDRLSGRVAAVQFFGLVAFSTLLMGFIIAGADAESGFLPVALEYPPSYSEQVGYDPGTRATQVVRRGDWGAAGDSRRLMVRNIGEDFVYRAEEGDASWYGYDHLGRRVATGAWFDPEAMTVAHRTFPLGSMVRVTRTDTGESIMAEVNDRGPFVKGRIVDLARKPAEILGMLEMGVAPCRVEVVRYPKREG